MSDRLPEEEQVEVVDELASAQKERDEYLDALQRLKAEFDNYRKRVAREGAALAAHASERLVRELVPVLDDLERALEFAAAHEEAQLEDGVRLVHRALADALAKEGLAEIETDGKFDPHTQEALLSQPSESEEGTVIQVLQKGYRLGDRIVRPARVVISAGSAVA
jgi:molecular chaperone GrpE